MDLTNRARKQAGFVEIMSKSACLSARLVDVHRTTKTT